MPCPKGYHVSPGTEFKKGQIPWNKGLTKETDERVRLIAEKESKTHKEQYRKGRMVWNEGLTKETDERVKKNALATSKGKKGKRYPKVLEVLKRITPLGNEATKSFGARQKRQAAAIRQFEDPLQRELRSKLLKKRLKDLEFKNTFLKRSYKARVMKPTKLEKKFIEFIGRNNLPIEYVGDGKLWIGGKCPDFIYRGRKVLYETAEPYHKRKYGGLENYLKVRQEHFGKYGYKVILVTPWDLNDQKKLLTRFGLKSPQLEF